MKKIYIALVLFTLFLQAELSIDQISDMVSVMRTVREGVNPALIAKTKDPFLYPVVDKNSTVPAIQTKEPNIKLVLHSIIGNKAFINDSWVSVNDVIMGWYKLSYIGKKGVVLTHKNIIKKLFLHKKRDEFIKIEGR